MGYKSGIAILHCIGISLFFASQEVVVQPINLNVSKEIASRTVTRAKRPAQPAKMGAQILTSVVRKEW